MPKAENRKKPPNQSGLVPGRKHQAQFEPGQRNAESDQRRQTQKQDLIAKMKSIQQHKDKK